MTRPRNQQISLVDTPFYHCVTRYTRQSFLCGFDKFSNRSYEHRRQEIQDDMLRLACVFSIEIVAFCVMSNHYHLVLHVCRDECLADSPESIIRRAHQLVAGNDVTHKFMKKQKIESWERDQLDIFVDTWRKRLYDISWFMKFLNEGIARRANKEDKCTGHFWEARYKSQALLDEKAVLSAMAYVDLNPIRAAMATTPEESDHTSIQLRIEYWKEKASGKQDAEPDEDFQPDSLMPFVGNPRQPMPAARYGHCVCELRQTTEEEKKITARFLPDLCVLLSLNDACPSFWKENGDYCGVHYSTVSRVIKLKER